MTARNRHDEATIKRLHEELGLLFLNEITDERLQGITITGVAMPADRHTLTVLYLPPHGREDDAAAALPRVTRLVEARASEVMNRAAQVKFEHDRGAENARRVQEILEELRRKEGGAQ